MVGAEYIWRMCVFERGPAHLRVVVVCVLEPAGLDGQLPSTEGEGHADERGVMWGHVAVVQADLWRRRRDGRGLPLDVVG